MPDPFGAEAKRHSERFRMAVTFFVTAIWCAVSNAQPPVYRWTFSEDFLRAGSLSPETGDLTPRVPSALEFSETPPAAMVFPGSESNGILTLTENPQDITLPAEKISVEAWVLVEKTIDWGGLVGLLQDNGDYERGWVLGYRNDRFCFGLVSSKTRRITYLTSPASFEPGYWYHVVGTYDGRNLRLFSDGKERAVSQEQAGPIVYPKAAKFVIGGYVDDNEKHPFTGQIQQISIYDRALSAVEIETNFKQNSHRFPEVHPVVPQVTGWPTYRRDNQRTGLSTESLPFPLKRRWTWNSAGAPQPAWPPPAENDFWHRKHNLQPRVVFDRAYHTVTDGKRVYFGTSTDCRIVCLNLSSGREEWSYHAAAPVRLAPTIDGEQVLFGADDGCVYALNAGTGHLNWRYRPAFHPERWLPGNQRLMSSLPIRSGILVEDNVAYFCAGVFPSQGVYQIAIDTKTGHELAHSKISVSAQGYLERRAGRLYVPAARDPAGSFAAQLARRGKGVDRTLNTLQQDFRYAFIGAGEHRIGGGDGKVAAFRASDGVEIWSAEINGKAYGLATAGGHLLVSTDAGFIYCYADPDKLPPVTPGTAIRHVSSPGPTRHQKKVREILTQAEIRKGYCLIADSLSSDLAIEVARQSDLSIVVLQPDPQKAAFLRQNIAAAGLYGRIVVHERDPGQSLPYTDYMFNLILSERAVNGDRSSVDAPQLFRMLRPQTGVAVLDGAAGSFFRRGPLDGIGEWTHMYANPANTSCSADTHVHGRLQLQWFGEPGPQKMLNRHHRTAAPLWKNGRLFIPGNDQVFASDAYNGTLLWTKKIPGSRRIAVFRDCSYMAAGENHLFVAANDSCHALNPQTGSDEHTYQVPQKSETANSEWGFVATVGSRLIGSATRQGASRREHTRDSIIEAAYFDDRDVVCSHALFGYDTTTTAHEWRYDAQQGAIINSTITVADGQIFFVESHNPGTLQTTSGRHQLTHLLSAGSSIVSISESTGDVLWQRTANLQNVRHNLYAQQAAGNLVLVGTGNSGGDRKESRVIYEIRVCDSTTGEPVWQTTQTQDTKIDGDHGEQDLHPVIVGQRLYCEPKVYKLDSGEQIDDWGWKLGKRSGCGNISASADSLFFRQNHPTMFELSTREYRSVTTTTRPGCLINIIPAGGLLLIPEASSGCTCNYGVQTSLAFLPMSD